MPPRVDPRLGHDIRGGNFVGAVAGAGGARAGLPIPGVPAAAAAANNNGVGARRTRQRRAVAGASLSWVFCLSFALSALVIAVVGTEYMLNGLHWDDEFEGRFYTDGGYVKLVITHSKIPASLHAPFGDFHGKANSSVSGAGQGSAGERHQRQQRGHADSSAARGRHQDGGHLDEARENDNRQATDSDGGYVGPNLGPGHHHLRHYSRQGTRQYVPQHHLPRSSTSGKFEGISLSRILLERFGSSSDFASSKMTPSQQGQRLNMKVPPHSSAIPTLPLQQPTSGEKVGAGDASSSVNSMRFGRAQMSFDVVSKSADIALSFCANVASSNGDEKGGPARLVASVVDTVRCFHQHAVSHDDDQHNMGGYIHACRAFAQLANTLAYDEKIEDDSRSSDDSASNVTSDDASAGFGSSVSHNQHRVPLAVTGVISRFVRHLSPFTAGVMASVDDAETCTSEKREQTRSRDPPPVAGQNLVSYAIDTADKLFSDVVAGGGRGSFFRRGNNNDAVTEIGGEWKLAYQEHLVGGVVDCSVEADDAHVYGLRWLAAAVHNSTSASIRVLVFDDRDVVSMLERDPVALDIDVSDMNGPVSAIAVAACPRPLLVTAGVAREGTHTMCLFFSSPRDDRLFQVRILQLMDGRMRLSLLSIVSNNALSLVNGPERRRYDFDSRVLELRPFALPDDPWSPHLVVMQSHSDRRGSRAELVGDLFSFENETTAEIHDSPSPSSAVPPPSSWRMSRHFLRRHAVPNVLHKRTSSDVDILPYFVTAVSRASNIVGIGVSRFITTVDTHMHTDPVEVVNLQPRALFTSMSLSDNGRIMVLVDNDNDVLVLHRSATFMSRFEGDADALSSAADKDEEAAAAKRRTAERGRRGGVFDDFFEGVMSGLYDFDEGISPPVQWDVLFEVKLPKPLAEFRILSSAVEHNAASSSPSRVTLFLERGVVAFLNWGESGAGGDNMEGRGGLSGGWDLLFGLMQDLGGDFFLVFELVFTVASVGICIVLALRVLLPRRQRRQRRRSSRAAAAAVRGVVFGDPGVAQEPDGLRQRLHFFGHVHDPWVRINHLRAAAVAQVQAEMYGQQQGREHVDADGAMEENDDDIVDIDVSLEPAVVAQNGDAAASVDSGAPATAGDETASASVVPAQLQQQQQASNVRIPPAGRSGAAASVSSVPFTAASMMPVD